jgi:gas vesicle protein
MSVFNLDARRIWEGQMAIGRSDESRHDFAFIAGAIIGAIAGALVTLALTPMSGADTREKLKSRTAELGPIKERALEAAAPVKDKALHAAAPVKEKAGALAATATEKGKTLAAKTPIGRGGDEVDATDMGPEEAGSMLFGSQPDAHPGGTVTPGALADAGADVTGTTERPPRLQPITTAEGAHPQDAAEGPRDTATDSGNGRVSEKPVS